MKNVTPSKWNAMERDPFHCTHEPSLTTEGAEKRSGREVRSAIAGTAFHRVPADAEQWTITVRAEGDGPPLPVRVRKFLKLALRTFRLRCVSVAPANNDRRADR